MTDTDLLKQIRGVLADSPFVGEGHRKVWARLRRERGVYTSRKRVLRLTREAGLLAPTAQVRKRAARLHDATITVTIPDTLWATDATEAWSAEGRSAVFAIIDHASGEVWTDASLRMDRWAAADLLREVTTERFGYAALPVLTGHSIRSRRSACRESRRPVWTKVRWVASAQRHASANAWLAPAESAREDRPVQRGLRQLLQREIVDMHVIVGVVGAGVAGAQQRGEHLAPAGHQQRVMTEAALVMAGRALVLAVSADREGVESSRPRPSGRPPLLTARSRATARARRIAASSTGPSDTITRRAVETDATAPNSAP
jgi:hypothetical protein